MEKLQSIQDYYISRYNWIPQEISRNLGHFNVFDLAPFVGVNAKPLEYRRRDWYNITLVYGSGRFNYADKVYDFKNCAIAYNNPQTPYNWENRDQMTGGYFCLFNKQFLQKDTSLIEYPLFQPGNRALYELTDAQAKVADDHFQRLFKEMKTTYTYKYDVAKIIVAELLHFTMKLDQFDGKKITTLSASERITMQFLDILERQFPIEDPLQTVQNRTASDFAKSINIHVNHLNRAIKETTQKTTTLVIKERLLQESEILLKYTSWNIAEIAFALGFSEPTHFNNFFKKETGMTPIQFRNN